MQVAGQLAVARRRPGSGRSRCGPPAARRRPGSRRTGSGDQVVQRDGDVAGVPAAELQRAGDQPLLVLEQPLAPATRPRSTGPPRAVNAEVTSSLGSTPSSRSDAVGQPVQRRRSAGRGRPGHQHQRRGEQQRGAVGPGEGEVLRAPSRRGRRAGRRRCASASAKAIGWTSAVAAARRVRAARRAGGAIAGSATAPRPQRADGDAELGARPASSDTCSIAQSVVRRAALPAAASGSIWLRRADMMANSAPTKNALPQQQHQGHARGPDPVAHAGLPRPWRLASGVGRRGMKRSRSTRRPSIAQRPAAGRRPTATSSPTRGTRPSTAMTKPPSVS